MDANAGGSTGVTPEMDDLLLDDDVMNAEEDTSVFQDFLGGLVQHLRTEKYPDQKINSIVQGSISAMSAQGSTNTDYVSEYWSSKKGNCKFISLRNICIYLEIFNVNDK